ncbi:MAG: NUDIX domain-containing protein [Candidatus Bathyarchaeota archaeon]|nr:MAG: NUDIX domain-containing protein [Candidatus Bathyarchaeota archaeon]
MDKVEVVVGVLLKGNRFLVERRGFEEEIDPGILCLPGGHVRKRESREEALKREMLEELNIAVKKSRFICKNLYVASNGERQNAYCYFITDYEGEPKCKSAQEIFWENNIENLSLDVDKKTIEKLKELRISNRTEGE